MTTFDPTINTYISADGHVVEPADLWTTRMDKRFRDRAPRVESRPDNDYYMIDGIPPFPVGLEGAMMEDKVRQGQVDTPMGRRHADTRPGAWDPHARLADQDLDHLRAEVVYPGIFGLLFFNIQDAEYQRECVRVYNDWVSEFCAVSPKRLLGAGILPMGGPVEWAITEAERVAKKGLVQVMIPCEVADRSYSSRLDYEPLWAALQDLGLSAAAHSGTSTGEPFTSKYERMGVGLMHTDGKVFQPQRALADLIWGGVPARYPKLKFVMVEGGVGWIATVLADMDHFWKDHHRWVEPKLDELPSFYFRRQFWATFEDDRAGVLTRELIGVDRLMWGADYPHTEGVWPRSREQIAKDFAGVPEDEVYQMVVSNAAQLYGIA
jgi:predicted TIM-barrel fold metal-dependent hydrolase